jgi:hypothetical protein
MIYSPSFSVRELFSGPRGIKLTCTQKSASVGGRSGIGWVDKSTRTGGSDRHEKLSLFRQEVYKDSLSKHSL